MFHKVKISSGTNYFLSQIICMIISLQNYSICDILEYANNLSQCSLSK